MTSYQQIVLKCPNCGTLMSAYELMSYTLHDAESWSDGQTGLNVYFYSKGLAKSQVSVQHVKLQDNRQVAEKKMFWAEALEQLNDLLQPHGSI